MRPDQALDSNQSLLGLNQSLLQAQVSLFQPGEALLELLQLRFSGIRNSRFVRILVPHPSNQFFFFSEDNVAGAADRT